MKMSKQYEYMNLTYINDLTDGDDDFLMELVETFLTTIPPVLHNLKIAIEIKDYTAVYFNAHKLKGSFNFIGSTQLGNAFKLLEQYCEDVTKQDQLAAILLEVNDIAAKLMAELDSFIADNKKE